MTAKALLDRNPNPSDAEIRQGMAGGRPRLRGWANDSFHTSSG